MYKTHLNIEGMYKYMNFRVINHQPTLYGDLNMMSIIMHDIKVS